MNIISQPIILHCFYIFFGTQNIDSLAPSLVQTLFTTTNGSIIIIT